MSDGIQSNGSKSYLTVRAIVVCHEGDTGGWHPSGVTTLDLRGSNSGSGRQAPSRAASKDASEQTRKCILLLPNSQGTHQAIQGDKRSSFAGEHLERDPPCPLPLLPTAVAPKHLCLYFSSISMTFLLQFVQIFFSLLWGLNQFQCSKTISKNLYYCIFCLFVFFSLFFFFSLSWGLNHFPISKTSWTLLCRNPTGV